MAAKPKKKAEEAEEDAEAEANEAGEGEAPAKKRLPLKLIIIVLGTVVVLGGVGSGAYFFLSHKPSKPVEAAVKPAVFIDIPEVLVNLANAGTDRTQYLKVKVVLEVPDAALKEQIAPVMPRVMDTFQTYLRELRPTDLEGSAGLYRLKEELTRRVNAAISPNRVNAVLFKEIVVQ
jgi:flagellar protein FliL